MKGKTHWLKRIGAGMLCLCMLCSVLLSGLVLPTKVAAAETPPATFSVDFSNLAALVQDADYDANGLYSSKYNDDAINDWANTYFDIYMTTQGSATTERLYLGQSSYSFMTDSYENQWGGEHSWVIDKTGYLIHNVTKQGNELLRKGEQMVFKTSTGAQATLKNFEATVVFNTEANGRGAVALSFHEDVNDPGHLINNQAAAKSDAVIIGRNSDTADDYVLVRKIGSDHSKKDLSNQSFTDGKTSYNADLAKSVKLSSKLADNTDYTLYVKVLNGKATVKISNASSTVYSGEFDVTDTVGTISLGATNANRSFKSIEVKELNDAGEQVDFGSENPNVSKFTYSFNNVIKMNNGTGNHKYPNGKTWFHVKDEATNYPEAVAEMQYNLRQRFDEYMDAQGEWTKTDFAVLADAGTNNGTSDGKDNGGFWQLWEGWIQRKTYGVYWKQNMRLVSSMVPKDEITGEPYKMTNFETSFTARFEGATGMHGNIAGSEHTQTTVVLGFRQGETGHYAVGENWVRSDQAYLAITQSGITVAGGDNIPKFNTADVDKAIHKALYNGDATYSFADFYTPTGSAVFDIKVRVVGNEMWLKVTTGSTVLFDNFAGGKDQGVLLNLGNRTQAGAVAYGLGEFEGSINNIKLTRLDVNGKPIDLNAASDGTAAEEFAVDFADLAAIVPANTYTDGLYSSKYDDEEINNWANKRFNIYFGKESQATTPQLLYLGQSSYNLYADNGENTGWGGEHKWLINQNGYLQYDAETVPYETVRKGEQLAVKTADGALAQMENFEATMVFNTLDNNKGGVAISFHEKAESRVTDQGDAARSNSNVVYILNNNARAGFTTSADAVVVRASGKTVWKPFHATEHGDGILLNEMFGDGNNLAKNTDYKLFVRVLNKEVLIRVTSVDGSKVYYSGTTTLESSYNGTISFGVFDSDRAIKSITVKEMDANGVYVDFGTATVDPEKFTFGFDNLLRFNNGTGNFRYDNAFSNGASQWWLSTADANVKATVKEELLYHLQGTFNEYLDATAGNVTKTNFEKTEGAGTPYGNNDKPDNAGFWESFENRWMQRIVDNVKWRENLRLVTTIIPKSQNTGEMFKMTNFETSFIGRFDTVNGSIVLDFRQQTPGKLTVGGDAKLYKEHAFISITQTGITVAGGNDITAAMYNSDATYQFTDHTAAGSTVFCVKVRVVGDDVKLRVYKENGTDLFNNFTGGKDVGVTLDLGGYVKEGYIGYGVGEDKVALRSIELVKLDENGNPTDIDPYVEPEEEIIDVEQFTFDADLGDYTGDSAALDTQADALKALNTKFMHYFVHGDTYEDFPWYGNAGGNDGCGNWQLENNAWLSRTDVKNGGERLRQINALIPKDANGNAAQTENLIAEFDYRFDNENSTVIFGFRQKNPAKFINGTDRMNQEQVLVAINKTALSVKAGTGITTEEFYSEKATYGTYATALKDVPDEIHVRIKAVGTECTVILSSLDGKLLAKNTYTVTNTGIGYMALGIAAGEGSIGDVTITRLDDAGQPADFTILDYQDKVYDDGIVRFSADFSGLATLAEDFTNGVYVPTATDRAINHWFDSRFALYFNLNYRNTIHEKNYAGESSSVYDADDSKTDASWRGGEVYWQLDQNGYLTHYASGTGWEMMRKIQLLTLKAPDGNAATVKNFEATFTVHDEKQAEGAVLLSFRNDKADTVSPTSNSTLYANQQLLAIGYDGSGNAGMNLGGGAAELSGTYDAFKISLDALKGVTDYKVYVKVLGEDIIVKITSPDDATTYYDNSATPAKAVMQDAGYMMLGVSNSTKSLVDLTVTELDDNGNAIHFGTNTGKGDIFEFSVADAVPRPNGKYENGESWIDFAGSQADPEAETTSQMVSLLNSKFAIYYNHQGRYQQTEAGLRETYEGQTADYAYLGRLFANKWLQRLVENSGGKQTMRLITGMVPRNTNTGEELRMKNFETSFQFRFETTGYHSEAAIIGFRQQTPGKFVDGYFNVNQEQGLVVITRHGISVAAGEDIFSGQHMTEDGKETHRPLDGDLYDGAQAITFDDPATADVTETLPQIIGIKVRVVEDQLWLTVTDEAGTVLYNNNGEPFTVNYDKEGYITYGFGNWQAGIANIKLARLDENGKQIDINNASSSVDAQWDVTAQRYSQVMGSVKKDIVTALDYYYSSLKDGSTAVVKETMDVHWALNNNGILMRHSDLSTHMTSNVATMKWNLFEDKETIQNYDAVFKLHLDAAESGTFWVVSGQTDKANIGKVTATDGGTDYIAGQMAVGLAVGGDIILAPGDGTFVEIVGPTMGTPDGIYNLRVRKSGNLLEVYLNGTLRVTRTLDASAVGEGYLYYGYSGAALGIAEVNVTRLNEYGVAVDFTTEYTGVETVADRMVDKGATKAELNLPTTLKVYKGTAEETSNVYWDCSGIDFETEGEYVAIGYLENTNGIRAVAKVQVGKYDPENTVVYSFNDSSVLDKLDTYFLPEASAGNQPAIHVKDTDNENWYVSGGKLRIKHNSYRHTKAELIEGFDLNGVHYQNTDNVFALFQSNIAIAVLREQTYENFILDLDYRGYYDWSFVGIGADATDGNSVFGSQDNGGTTFFVAYNSGSAGINTWANGKCWNTSNSLSPYDISAGNEPHHMRIIVSDGVASFYLDDIASPVTVQLPDSYDGGYIYLGLNSTECYFDNLKITDLDAKKIEITDLNNTVDEITIDRAAGDTISLPTKAVAVDKDGYEYTLPIEWENEEYRSGKSGDYVFTPAVSLHNVSIADGVEILVKNRINGEYDETTSVKYYFDHKNDLLDFNSYYSEPVAEEDVPSYWDESKWGTMYNAHNGDLTHSEDPLARWTVTANGATTVRSDSNGGYGVHKLFTNLETMTLKQELNLNLTSYKLEMDFNHALGDWWYTYMLFGVQDPSKYMSRWASHNGTYSQYARQYAREGGVYYWIEQEGYMNIMGALVTGGERTQMDIDYIYDNVNWPGAYERDETHHLTVYVFDQRAFVQVDDSGYVEIALTPNAVGGLAGFASHGNDSTVSNFQLTAIDGDTFDAVNDTCKTVPLATAQRGWAPDQSYDDFNAWKPSKEDLEYDWKDHITSY